MRIHFQKVLIIPYHKILTVAHLEYCFNPRKSRNSAVEAIQNVTPSIQTRGNAATTAWSESEVANIR